MTETDSIHWISRDNRWQQSGATHILIKAELASYIPIMYTFELADIVSAIKSLKALAEILTLASFYHLQLEILDPQLKESSIM